MTMKKTPRGRRSNQEELRREYEFDYRKSRPNRFVSTKNDKRTSGKLRREYRRSDFGKLERGKYYERVRANTNVVVLDPDVASVFRSPESVNSLVRSVIKALPKRAKT
jgi:hypothetical protein